MNRIIIRTGIFLCLLLFFSVNIYAQNDRYLIEAEAFQFKGKWTVANERSSFAGKMLRVFGGGSNDEITDALTVVNIWEEGEYNVWVRAYDDTDKPGTRLFRLSVNEQPMEVSGKHGQKGFYWEKVGTVSLEKKEALLRIHDVNRNYARCDAVLLIRDHSINPNEVERIEVGKWRKNPVKAKTNSAPLENLPTRLFFNGKESEIAAVENDNLKLSFVAAGVNNSAIACKTEVKINGKWKRFLSPAEDHKVVLLHSESPKISNENYFPSWPETEPRASFSFNGQVYRVQEGEDLLNPYYAGTMSEAIPVDAVKLNTTTIKVQYLTRDKSVIVGYWKLPKEGNYMEVSLVCHPAQAGSYSMGVSAFQLIPENKVSNILLPPLYQYKRIPEQPTMLLSSMMQQPMSIAEVSTDDGLLSTFVCGDLAAFGKEGWGSVDYSPIGFSIKNEVNFVQPSIFSPVLGMEDAIVKEGETLNRKFIIGIFPGGWNETVEYISDNIFNVKDYRQQNDVSLTDALFNIVDLMSDKEYGGWDESLKGFYDIEGDPSTAPTVVHAAPLSIIATSIFGKSEDFYLSHALPTIEYTLSRSGYRWAIDLVPNGYNHTLETLRLNPYDSQFTTTYYEGLHDMLGGLNPWIKKIALPGDTLRKPRGYSVPINSWVQALSAYRLTNDRKWLQFATSTADRFINTQIYTHGAKLISPVAFYNTIFYAAWWDLIDLYEQTNDKKYINAAQYGAAHTIAGIRAYPAVPDGDMVIHRGGKYEGNTNLWWKGTEKYRLGFPRQENDMPEKMVPAWLVSPVGLGFEQSSTYFLKQKGKLTRPVFMSNWAPHLLRLYQHTHKDIYQTYARNAIIGRFANYPGYYATGYTDVIMSAEFPYKGPDVSSIYYHHIPPHLAFVWDYLVSEAIERSGSNVYFPYDKQEGFVWFANRIYGAGKGRVFEDNNVELWVKRGLVGMDNPSINYITAISDKNFWVILSSESDKEESFVLTINEEPHVAGQEAVLYSENGEIANIKQQDNRYSTSIPAKGFRAISFPLASERANPVYSELKNGIKVIEMGEPLGKIFLFRIRSPFGWDSVYGFAETHPQKEKQITIQAECGGESKTVTTYPFEWSFYKISMDNDVEVTITTQINNKDVIKKVVLPAN